jgi:hypothetical protein
MVSILPSSEVAFVAATPKNTAARGRPLRHHGHRYLVFNAYGHLTIPRNEMRMMTPGSNGSLQKTWRPTQRICRMAPLKTDASTISRTTAHS